MQIEKAFVSGSLEQAIIYFQDGNPYVLGVRGRKPRVAYPDEMRLFQNMAQEWIPVDSGGEELTLRQVKEILKKEVNLFEGLDGLLVGMDPKMSSKIRIDAILQSERILKRDRKMARQIARRFYIPVDQQEWNPSIGIKTARANGAARTEAFYRPLVEGSLVDQITGAIASIVSEQLGSGVNAAVYRKRLMRSGLIGELVHIIEKKAYLDIVDLVENTDLPRLSDNTARILLFGLAVLLFRSFKDIQGVSGARYIKALFSIGKDLFAAEPKNAAVQRGLAFAYIQLAKVCEDQDEMNKAFEQYREFLPIGKHLFAMKSNTVAMQQAIGFDIILAHGKLAALDEGQGDISSAEKHYKESLLVVRRLSRAKPEDPEMQQGIGLSFAFIYAKLGDLYVEQNNISESRKFYEKSLSIMKSLLNIDPSNPMWIDAVYTAHLKIGSLYETLGNISKAVKQYKSSLSVLGDLSDDELDKPEWLSVLDLVHDKLGMLYERQKNISKAVKHYKSSLMIAEKLSDNEPENTIYLQNLDIAYGRLGILYEKEGNLLKAQKYYESSLSTGTRLLATESQGAILQSIGFIYYRLGVLHEKRGNFSDAQKYYGDSLSSVECWYDAESNNIEAQETIATRLALLHYKYGEFCEEMGDVPKAKKHYELSLGFVKSWPSIEERSVIALHFAIVYHRLGRLCQRDGSLSEANEYYESALSRLNHLFALGSDNVEFHQFIVLFIVFTHCSFGMLCEEEGDLEKARKHYELALSFREHLSVGGDQNTGLRHINRILDSVDRRFHISSEEKRDVSKMQEHYETTVSTHEEYLSNADLEDRKLLQGTNFRYNILSLPLDREWSTVNVNKHYEVPPPTSIDHLLDQIHPQRGSIQDSEERQAA